MTPRVTSAQTARSGKAVSASTATAGKDPVDEGGDRERRDEPAQGLPEGPARPSAEQLEGAVEGADCPAAHERERSTTPYEQAPQRHDERGDAEVGDEEPVKAADQRAQGDARPRARRSRCTADPDPTRGHWDPFRLDQRHDQGRHGKDRSDRQVDIARHDDQHHASRHDGDGRRLDRQVPEVAWGQEEAVGHDIEDDPDHGEGQHHPQQPAVDLEAREERSR